MRQHVRIAVGAVDAGDGRGFRKRLAQFRMIAGAVIALAVVLPDELPVALFHDGALEGDLRLGQPVRPEIGLHQRAERREVGRLVGQADEDIAADALAGDRLQPVVALVEAVSHLAGEEQGAVEVVGPLVIGTDEPRRGALVGRADAAAAMAAGIVEGADAAFAVANDHHRVGADLHGEEAAGTGDLAVVADEEPVAVPDQFHVELEEAGVGVERLLQREARASAADEPQHVVARIHVVVLA